MDRRVFSTAWLAVFPVVYLVHLVDERYFWIGTAEFSTRYFGIYFTNGAWWAVNVPSLLLVILASVLTARGTWPQWVAIALAVHLLLHGLLRIPTSLWTLEIAPGLLTGVALCAPLAAATLRRGYGAFPRPEWNRGLVVGLLSFQPLWHAVLLPFLPAGPAPA
ncbi:MAG: hypothetical protein ACR2P8_11780 [Myxococcota bacterium]